MADRPCPAGDVVGVVVLEGDADRLLPVVVLGTTRATPTDDAAEPTVEQLLPVRLLVTPQTRRPRHGPDGPAEDDVVERRRGGPGRDHAARGGHAEILHRAQAVSRPKKTLFRTSKTRCPSDSKSDAPKGVVGSNPMPSALENKGKNDEKSPGNRAFFMRRPNPADCRNIRACPTMSGVKVAHGVAHGRTGTGRHLGGRGHGKGSKGRGKQRKGRF